MATWLGRDLVTSRVVYGWCASGRSGGGLPVWPGLVGLVPSRFPAWCLDFLTDIGPDSFGSSLDA